MKRDGPDPRQGSEEAHGIWRRLISKIPPAPALGLQDLRKFISKLRLPALISLPAVIFGIVVFWENHHEVFHPDSASLNAKVGTTSGYAIRITLTNNGNPPVVIDRASLDLPRAEHNLPIFFYLSDPRVIDGYSTDPSRIRAERQALPIAVEPHTTQSVALLADPDAFNNDRTKLRIVREEQSEFCEFVREGTPRPTLRLHTDWSGVVLSDKPPFLGADDTYGLQVRIAGKKLNQPSWEARVIGSPPGAPTSIRFRRRLAEPSVGAIAKMTLYTQADPNAIHQLGRPLVGHAPTAFQLPPLDEGIYLVAFTVDDEVVVTARLPVPAPEPGYDLAHTGPGGSCGQEKRAARARAISAARR